MEQRQQRAGRVRQCNLDLDSDLSLTALVSGGSSQPVTGASSTSRGLAVSSAAATIPPPAEKGVSPHRKSRVAAIDRPTSNSGGSFKASCRSDTDRESSNGEGREGKCVLQAESQSSSVQLHVYTELMAIKDKMKDEFVVLAVEEEKIRQMTRDIALREEEMSCREEEMKCREEEIRCREEEMKCREEEVKCREEEMRSRDEKMTHNEEEVTCREDEIILREKKMNILQMEIDQKGEKVKAHEEEASVKEQEIERKESEIREKEDDMNNRETVLKKKEAVMIETLKDMRLNEEGLTLREELMTQRETELVVRETEANSREKNLEDREEKVIAMEKLVCETHQRLVEWMEREVDGRLREIEEGEGEERERLGREARERAKELKRVRECYRNVKKANESLKKELQDARQTSQKLQAQLSVAHGHLAAVQREKEQLTSSQGKLERQRECQQHLAEARPLKKRLTASHTPPDKGRPLQATEAEKVCCDLLKVTMEWLCRAHLSRPLSAAQVTHTRETCSRILPSLAALLPSLSDHSLLCQLQQPALELAHWCVGHVAREKKMKVALSATLRRIGEAVCRHMMAEERGDQAEGLVNSSDIHISTLSRLIVLQTLTQVDILAKVLDSLYHTMQEDTKVKEVFLLYNGVDCILQYMRLSHNLLCTHSVNICLLLSSEPEVFPQGLSRLGERQCLSVCAALLREANNTATLEKLSIILQRLSKIRGMRAVFESEKVVVAMQEVLRQRQTDTDSAFLCLNIQSTISNLNQQ